LEIVSVIPKLLKIIGWDAYTDLYETIHERGALNHYQAIRDQVLENFVALKDIFGYERLRGHLRELVISLSNQKNYIFRVTALHSFIKLKTTLTPADLLSLFDVYIQYIYNYTGGHTETIQRPSSQC
jgi:serine/threonine-protein phosphatase 2A regulatory subunit A